MTNNQHGQVPDALRLVEEITNLECSSEAVAKTIAAAADELCRLHVENASLRASPAASPTPPAEQQAKPKTAPGEPDKLMRDCLALLESFDYEDDKDSQSKAFFNAHINADWFFHVKRSIERQLEAKAAPMELNESAYQRGYLDGMAKGRREVEAAPQQEAGAVPQGWKAVPVNPTPEMWKAAKSVPGPNPPYPPHYGLVWDAMLAASPTPPAEQQAPATEGYVQPVPDKCDRITWRGRYYHLPLTEQAAPKAAPGVGNSGFDHQTAADFLSGKTVSDEAVRKFVQASRRAHDERAALSATLLAMHGVLTSREAEIALLKKALLEVEAAPQQEPVAWLNPWRADKVTTDYDAYGERGIPLYTAPQPAPAPLSDDAVQKTWALLDELEKLRGADRYDEDWVTLNKRDSELRAALAAQGDTP